MAMTQSQCADVTVSLEPKPALDSWVDELLASDDLESLFDSDPLLRIRILNATRTVAHRAFVESEPAALLAAHRTLCRLYEQNVRTPAQAVLVNISPKGMRGTLHVADKRTIAYLDYVGSGAEMVAHLRQNGRMVLMFCAFEGAPGIVRVHGTGAALAASTPAFASWLDRFPNAPRDGVRAVVLVTVARVSQSCGTGVPLMQYVEEREIIPRWAHNMGSQRLAAYRDRWNQTSIDGLPSFDETFVPSVPVSSSRPEPTSSAPCSYTSALVRPGRTCP